MTTHNHEDIRIEIDGDNIAVVTLDIAGQSANTMNEKYLPAMDWALDILRNHEGLAGVVWASAKKTFFAGGDLNLLGSMTKADAEILNYVEENKRPYRDMEKLGVPNVAAINGAARSSPSIAVRRTTPPAPGRRPRVTSGTPTTAFGSSTTTR